MENDNKLNRAKKKVEAMKGFYIHLSVYIVINAFILANVYMRTLGDGESFWKFSTFFTPIFWGIGVVFHAAHVFNYNPFFGKNWEERQIQKYIDKDQREAEKFK